MPRREQPKTEFLKSLLQEKVITLDAYQQLIKEETIDAVEGILAAQGGIPEEVLAKARGKAFGFPYEDLIGRKIDQKVLKNIPLEVAVHYQVAAYDLKGDVLSVALINATDLKAQEAVEFLVRERGLKVHYAITTLSAYQGIIKQYGSLGTEAKEALDVAAGKFAPSAKEKMEGMEEVVKSAPVSKMLSVILKHAVEARASDIHIEPVFNETRVRYRIDGELHTSLVLPKYIHSAIVSRVKVLANLRIDETRVPQDGRIRLEIEGREIDFRISTLPLYSNEKVVMRILDTAEGVPTLEGLGFDGKNFAIMKDNIDKPHGMFLVTGPTGSGKSTTLYAILNVLNSEGVNIVTLEDPVEYYLKGVNQSQVRPEVGFTFASGLRSILRQDPDTVMVGEIRDNETAELAIHAALTGHIVLSTLHTNDAFGAIPRFIDMKVEPFLIASTLNVVVAQRLVRKMCQFCKEPLEVPDNLMQEVRKELESVRASLPETVKLDAPLTFWRGKGCQRCNGEGYAGRTAIGEVLGVNKELKTIIANGAKYDQIRDAFNRQGMLTLKQDGILKAIAGSTTIEEVLSATKE
ncbi:MAG: GspE/PulE family protein [Patescibacteria group bacterium]